VTRRPPAAARRRVGVEHEYQLFDRQGSVDVRTLWPKLALDGTRLDPGDANAVRCRWGGVVTTDGREAEIATPPRRLGERGIDDAAVLADAGAAALGAALPDAISMRGYSTHLNVEVDDRRGRSIARSIAERTSPALMLLLDRADSPGLLMRARYRRLEVAGEFQRGEALVAALTMTAGVVLATEAAGRRRSGVSLPPALALRLVPSPQRYGWYVDRRAGGDDLYGRGRDALLHTAAGTSITAQQVLESAWAVARPFIADLVGTAALDAVDGAVIGTRTLPCERSADVSPTTLGASLPTPDCSVLDRRRRGRVSITTASATWHAIALRAELDGAVRWIRVPGDRADEFLAALDGGALDEWLPSIFARRRRDVIGWMR
jgi:hypothetical protein